MQRLSKGTARWLLFSDLHFKHHDLDRVRQTARWIVDEAERNRVGRVVICGDLLTSRSMQPTHVLSACYHFLGLLSDVVPRIHIILGNHDLAYRRDYQTTALNALDMNRLNPYVSLHSRIAHDEWDGRRVLLLPFREEQDELTDAVAALEPRHASETVAFAHLAINKAITQRYVVGAGANKPRVSKSITHRGFTGPDRFGSLARTFTGHFHSHQTIMQPEEHIAGSGLSGSVTYLGSPLQLNWADLYDTQRGIFLFNPLTLDHKMLINPHAVGYTTVELTQALGGQVDQDAVKDKHVMLLGELTHLKYVTARDKLLSLGVRSVRNWSPTGFGSYANPLSVGGFGASVPMSDATVQPLTELGETQSTLETTSKNIAVDDSDTELKSPKLDINTEAREYVESLDLDESLLSRRDQLVNIGQRIIQASHQISDHEGEPNLSYEDFLNKSSSFVGTGTANELAAHVFVAKPRTLTISNFLGVQGTIVIDFQRGTRRGLTFLVGDNGSGKSTLVEAMVWCQFGRCIRSGLAANDVVNDSAGSNCSVTLEFSNGYTIARHRKHKTHGNRVIVSLNGEPQLQLEHPDARTTQAAINELLGIDYEMYVRTVVLGHESAASFLSSTLTQRRDLIEASLGLSILDQFGQVSKLLLKDIDRVMNDTESKLEGALRIIEYNEKRLQELTAAQAQCLREADDASESLNTAFHEYTATLSRIDEQEAIDPGHTRLQHDSHNEKATVTDGEHGLSVAMSEHQSVIVEPGEDIPAVISALQEQNSVEERKIQGLQDEFSRIVEQKHREPASWLDRLQQRWSSRLEVATSAHDAVEHKTFQFLRTYLLRLGLTAACSLLHSLAAMRKRFSRNSGSSITAISSIQDEITRTASKVQYLLQETESVLDLVKLRIDRIAVVQQQLTHVVQLQQYCDSLQQQMIFKRRDAETYMNLVETEKSSLQSLHAERDVLATRLGELATDRELFLFWSSATAKRARRAASSSTKTTVKSTVNFREHVLLKSLSELNTLLVQVLTAMYDDTRHMRLISAGMLRSLFDTDTMDAAAKDASPGSVLDPNLAVHSSLAYGKRSGGERKRVDLALFFALMQLSLARSAHRAHYLLVDEVFDSLDEAGQAAVVRLCGVLSQSVADWILVITHSRFLMEREPEQDAGKISVITARSGAHGTELIDNGLGLVVQ